MTATEFFGSYPYRILAWFLFSLGLWLVMGKLHSKQRWWAWFPGLRYAELGACLGMDKEGAICGLMDVLQILSEFVEIGEISERVEIALTLLRLVLLVMLYIYRIRLFLRLRAIFSLKRRWLFYWLVSETLTVLALGLSRKYQPQMSAESYEEWKAGTAPAPLAVSGGAGIGNKTDSGLTILLRERSVKDFSKKRYLLKDISLHIPNGSLVLLLGGSGSGKTTFVNAVIGYEQADADIFLNGSDVYKDYSRMKYRIGFVPQQNLIRGNDTVIRTVSDAAEMRMPAKVTPQNRGEKITEVMDQLGLSAGCDGLVAKKSGGQLRRISIAMELISDPELFVLDEPDSGLDGVIARELFTKLREIADTGKIVIAITHTPDRVIDLFDKVIVLARDSGRVGRLAFYGSPKEAKAFFGKDSMEGIVMSVNRKEEGGDGLADEFIERYARLTAGQEGGAEA